MSRILGLVLGLSLVALPCQAQGVLMLAGGGSEGDIGDTTSWSYRLYHHLLDGGDVNGDGRVTVAVVADSSQSEFIPQYFEWLGATDAFNVIVATRSQAQDPAVVDSIRGADAIFIKGGDQGEYYDRWNGTRLEDNLRYVAGLNGGIGGTSAGAMSISQYAFAGGQDLVSLDVLTNAQTPYLNDTDGGSGIHTDFLGFLAGAVIDTHFTERGRLARLLGIMAKASEDNAQPGLLGIGLSDQTGLWIAGDTAQVLGVGSVAFLQQTPASVVHRPVGAPLYMSDLRADLLTEGWSFRLADKTVSGQPADAQTVSYPGNGTANSGSLTIKGNSAQADRAFALTATYAPQGYTLVPAKTSPYVRDAIGITDSQNSDQRGAIQETLLRGLYDYPNDSGFLVSLGGSLTRTSSTPNNLSFVRTSPGSYPESATVVFDGKGITAKSLSPYISGSDSGNGSLKAAALVNLRIHVLGQTSTWGTTYNTQSHGLQ